MNTPVKLSSRVVVTPLPDGQVLLDRPGLRIKFGIDPTSPNLHLGHAVPLRQLRRCQDMGHTVDLVIGDFTAAIGDPTGRNQTRPMLSDESIQANAATYLEQAFLILDRDRTQVHYNSAWLGQMSAADVVRMASQVTVARMAERDDFTQRLKRQEPVALHEFLYPLFQGLDSVLLKSDAEMGGTDQTFNLMMGRQMQALGGIPSQFVMTVPLLVGLDGKSKMSKSYQNDVGLLEPAIDKFTKIMRLEDDVIQAWGELLTDTPAESWEARLESEHPRVVKMALAHAIIAGLEGIEIANQARDGWEAVVCQGQTHEAIPSFTLDLPENGIALPEALKACGLASSSTVARQKIREGAVRWNGKVVSDARMMFSLAEEGLLQVGKRNFRKVSFQCPVHHLAPKNKIPG
jgi:tyrosyl-tRNA synthetase